MGVTLASVAWAIRASYHCTLVSTPGQYVFGIYVLFNLTPISDWRVVTVMKQRKVDIDNFHENEKQVRCDYAIGNLVYVKNTCIYLKLDYNNQVPYIIIEDFTNGTVRFQKGTINE